MGRPSKPTWSHLCSASFVFDNDEIEESSVVTSNDLRIIEIASDVPVVVGGIGRNTRCERIYRILRVAGQKDFALRRTS